MINQHSKTKQYAKEKIKYEKYLILPKIKKSCKKQQKSHQTKKIVAVTFNNDILKTFPIKTDKPNFEIMRALIEIFVQREINF